MSGGLIPPESLLRAMLKKHSARQAAAILTEQGYYAPYHRLITLRTILLANGEAKRMEPGRSGVYVPPAGDPTIGAEQASAALLKRQLTTGQHSICDPHRIAELLQRLAA